MFSLTVGACWLFSTVLLGQPGNRELRFEHIDGEKGLSHTTVTSVFQDRLGFMWFGTIDGLNLFDGYGCVVYKHDPLDNSSLSRSFIHCMVEDAVGNLWIGTRDGGLSVLTPEGRKTGTFLRYLPDPTKPFNLSHATVNTIYLDSGQRMWIGTTSGLDRFDPESGRFHPHHIFRKTPVPVGVYRLIEDTYGVLWIATADGLYAMEAADLAALDPADGPPQMKHFRHHPSDPSGLAINTVNSFFEDSARRLWFGTRGNGLGLFERETGTVRHFRHDPNDPDSISKNTAQVTYEDEHGILWVSTDGGGLNLLNPETGKFTKYRHQPSRTESISHDNVGGVYQSRDGLKGTIWVTTWGGGVNKLIDDDKPFQKVQHDPDQANSLSNNFVFALCEDRFGDLWVGTNGGGLNHWNRETGLWQRFLHDRHNPAGISDNNVWAIHEDRDGDIWITTERGGLNQVRRNDRQDPIRFIHHRFEADRESSLSEDNLRFFFQDRDGSNWVGYEEKGLSRQTRAQRTSGTWTHFRHDPLLDQSLSDNEARCMRQDTAGIYWVGTIHGGLNRLTFGDGPDRPVFVAYRHDPDDPRSLGHNDVRSIIETTAGDLWVGTYGGGLGRLDREAAQFHRYTTADGLANDFVYGLLEDDRGQLWISTNRGLSQLDPATENFTNYLPQHGLQSDEFNTGAYFKSSSGTLYFGGVKGFNYFNPEALLLLQRRQQDYHPEVTLTNFTIMGQPLATSPGLLAPGTVRLTHADKFFSFELAVLDYHQPEKNQFRYKLEGFNRGWVDNGNRHFASYTNLDPGSYRLRYQGADSNGSWNEGPPLRIFITPPFWQTWWFALIILVLLVLAVLTAAKIVTYYRAYRGLHYVGHFKILEKLGEGGSGTVYRARDKITRRIVALKVLNSRMEETRDGIRRFLQEAEIGSRLENPHIVTIFEAGSHGKTRYISMEYLKGQTLKQYLRQAGRLNGSEIYTLVTQILDGLAAIHREEIVHRDLKAANIMILDDGSVKIMDFGLARISALTTMENRNQLMGTLAYMSPEQTLGKGVDHRSDIYSLGVILYEMVLARLPFTGENEMEMIYAIHNQDPPGLEEIQAPVLATTITRCLAKDPADRFPSVERLLETLAGLQTTGCGASANFT